MSEVNDLYYNLKFAKNPNGNYTLLISHPNGTPHCRYDRERAEWVKANRDKTRQFVKWFRKNFKHIDSEFRGLVSSHWHDTKRHFVAYELTPKDFMYIKLAKQTDLRELNVGYLSSGQLGYDYIYENHTKPTEDYLARKQKAITSKLCDNTLESCAEST